MIDITTNAPFQMHSTATGRLYVMIHEAQVEAAKAAFRQTGIGFGDLPEAERPAEWSSRGREHSQIFDFHRNVDRSTVQNALDGLPDDPAVQHFRMTETEVFDPVTFSFRRREQ